MPRVSGIFDEFKGLDKISLEDITKWLSPMPNPITLYNFFCNRIYYPQTIPATKEELEFDLAILRQALISDLSYLNKNSKKIIIPERFLGRFPDPTGLVVAFIDAYIHSQEDNPYGFWNIVLKSETKEEKLASVIVPQFEDSNGRFDITIENRQLSVKAGQFVNTKCVSKKCKVIYQVQMGLFLGQKEGMIEISSGLAGVLIDGRRYG